MKGWGGVADFLEEKRKEIQARLKELKPLVEEYTRLEAAERALSGVGSNGASARSGSGASAAPRRRRSGSSGTGRRGRPRRSGPSRTAGARGRGERTVVNRGATLALRWQGLAVTRLTGLVAPTSVTAVDAGPLRSPLRVGAVTDPAELEAEAVADPQARGRALPALHDGRHARHPASHQGADRALVCPADAQPFGSGDEVLDAAVAGQQGARDAKIDRPRSDHAPALALGSFNLV